MSTKAGIWIDKRVAKIISGEEDGALMATIASNVEEFRPKGGSGSRMKGGPQDVVQDSKYTEREKHQLRSYFHEVAGQLSKVRSLVVFGPSQTGQKFAEELAKSFKHFNIHILGVEKADSMSDNQMVAWVRDYFKK